MGNAALTNDTTPTVDWADVSGANLYHAQISLFADFRSIASENNALATSTFTPGSALATNDAKYYWRWRYSTDAGTTWSVWSEKYSFWLKTTFTATRTPTTWEFVAVTPLDLSDRYNSAIYPEHVVTEEEIMRSQRRNLAGDLLVEQIVLKGKISLIYNGAYITEAQRNEILRFYNMSAGFYLLAAIYNQTENVEKVWKVIFSSPPVFNMMASGREDLFRTTLQLEEV